MNRPRDWVSDYNDLPKVEELLIATNPKDGSRWINGHGFFNWKEQVPPDREETEVERRDVWYLCTGYLIHQDDSQQFLSWAESVDFSEQGMPETATIYRMFLGEHAWAPASCYFEQPFYGDRGWMQPGNGCPVRVRSIAFEYLAELGGFDCSIDETYTLSLPHSELVTGLGIQWSGRGADFLDSEGRVAAQAPTVHADGPSALLLRFDLLQEVLAREGLTICWTIRGGKSAFPPGYGPGQYCPMLLMSGAYALSEARAIGFMKYMLDDPKVDDPSPRRRRLGVIRTGA